MATYTPLQPNQTPTLGTSGSAVLELQKQLNTKGAGLKLDSMYGPLTAAAVAKYNTTTTPTATVAPLKTLNVPTTPYESPELSQARTDYLSNLDTTPIDENKINTDTLSKFQAQIDATNAMYADELARAKVAGTGRLGTTTAMSARRGLLGSDFGESGYRAQEQGNEEVYKSIENERATKINQILSQARTDSTAAIKEKRAALTASLESRLQYYSEAESRKQEAKAKAIKQLISQGISPKELDPTSLSKLASYYGISTDEILSGYDGEKKVYDDAEAERLAKIAKDSKVSQPQSVQEYEYAKAAGYTGSYNDYQTLDANRKVSIARAGASRDGLTPYQQFSATQSIAKDTQARTENAREMARQAELIQSSYNNIQNGGNVSLNTQAIITSFNKILDPTSVVRESEYDRTAAGQSLLAQLEGKVRNIAEGGAGVTPATLKEAADIATRYLKGAQQTITAQNERARSMASQFGLNPDFVTGTYTVDNTSTDTGNDPLGIR